MRKRDVLCSVGGYLNICRLDAVDGDKVVACVLANSNWLICMCDNGIQAFTGEMKKGLLDTHEYKDMGTDPGGP